MTLESRDIIIQMLENDGKYPGDPQASSIYRYTHSQTGKELYAVFMSEQYNDIHSSPYVTRPVLLWDRYNGIANEGYRLILEKHV